MHRFACALAALAGVASTASATWSIVLIDTRTGEIALGSATCLTNFDLRAGTPVLIPGVGGATAQSFVDQGGYNRVFIRDRLLEGVAPEEILTLLESFDNGHDTRQYGMGDTLGRVATFTGDRAGEWAGGVTGRVGDIVYAVQGNVLAGEPVVTETEQVIVASLGAGLDLPETMMLAMEEAHLYGGDGRCSCSNNDADACGSPPDGWDPQTGKSAHIAYMLIARDGDGFGCNSVYRTGRAPMGVASGDFNGDGLIDLAAAARNDSVIDIMLNTALHEGYVSFAPAQSADAPGQPTGVAAADFDRDGRRDLVYADAQSDKVGLLYGAGDGTFTFPAIMAAQAGTSWVAPADFNADGWPDVAATNLDAGTVTILLNDGAGRLSAAQHAPAGIAPGVIVAAEIDGAAGIDLAGIDQGGPAVSVLANDGSGSFSLWRTLATDARPMSVAAGDFDGDGRTDLASANRDGRNVRVFRQTSPGAFESASIGPSQQYVAIEALDVNADGLDDLAASHDGSAGFTLLLGQGGADPAVDRTYALVNSTNDLAAADFTGDGLADLATNARAANGIMAVAGVDPDRAEGFFNNGYGCASAPYYMEFNVAFQKVTDPDPTVQLRAMFEPWRLDLLGVTDAVRTIADLGADRLPVGAATTLVIEPLDWSLAQVGPGLTIEAFHAEGSAGLTTLGDAVDRGDGTYELQISAATLPPEARGTDQVKIRVTQGGHQVILMPGLTVTVTGSLADWNGDGVVDPSDLTDYITDWANRDGPADLTGDGVIDSRDLIEYVGLWAGQ